MITPNAGPLVPAWVWEPFFPQADEDQLTELSTAWTDYAATQAETSAGLALAFENMDSHTGPGAEAAAAKAATVRGWLQTVIDAAESLAETTETAALLVTQAKRAINVVLAGLQVSTSQLAMRLAVTMAADTAAVVVQIRQLQIAAQAHCQAIAAALTDQLGALTPAVDIQPKAGTAAPGGGAGRGAGPGVGGTGRSGGAGDKYAPFNDTGLTPTSGRDLAEAEQQARELVGADEHDLATQSLDGAGAAAGPPTDPWATAADQAFTEEEREAMRQDAATALSTGDHSGYDAQSLAETAGTVTEDEIDPELLSRSEPGPGGAAGPPPSRDGSLLDEILGGPRTPPADLDRFEDHSPAPAPGTSAATSAPPATERP
ncbi:MAG: hypothetical protein GXX86_11690, partial [Propionibacterium sp.]|nr:hypothetical protein [Propionibacterium sp.]